MNIILYIFDAFVITLDILIIYRVKKVSKLNKQYTKWIKQEFQRNDRILREELMWHKKLFDTKPTIKNIYQFWIPISRFYKDAGFPSKEEMKLRKMIS